MGAKAQQFPRWEHYSIRTQHGDWGEIALKFTGAESVIVMALSSFGRYSHYWPHCGTDPRKFLAAVGIHYAMEKMSGYDLWEPDTDQWFDEVKLRVIEARRGGSLTQAMARVCWDEMLGLIDDLSDPKLILHGLYEHRHFEAVFGDIDGMPSGRRMKPAHVGFWNEIWLPFIRQMHPPELLA